jgi:hypothetical protein
MYPTFASQVCISFIHISLAKCVVGVCRTIFAVRPLLAAAHGNPFATSYAHGKHAAFL